MEDPLPSRLSFYFENQPSHITGDERPQKAISRQSSVHYQSPTVSAGHRRVSLDGRPSFDKFCNSPDSSLIRNVVINSLHREKPRVSVDNSNREVMAGLIRLKNLARSRSVGGRIGYARTITEVPRSSSLSAQRSSGIFRDGEEAIASEDARGHLAREKIASNLTQLRRSNDGSDSPRLTVELEEGPDVGSFKDSRHKFVDPKELQMKKSHDYEGDASRQTAFDFEKSLRAEDLKLSFRVLQKEKEVQRSLSDEGRSSLQVDGRRSPQRELPRDEQEGRRGVSNVVARLMGLEEFSSPPTRKDAKEEGSMDLGSKSASAETRVRGSGKYGHGQRRGRSVSPKHRLMDGMPSLLRQQEAREALKSRVTKSMKHFYEEGSLLTLQGCKTPSPTLEPLHGDIIQRLQQLRSRNSIEERDTLHQILETLQLKGLLHSPQRKSRDAASGFASSNIKTQCQRTEELRNSTPVIEHTALECPATPEYGKRLFASTKDASEHKIKHEAAIVVMKATDTKLEITPPNKDSDCKSARSGSSETLEIKTGARWSNEDGGSTKPGRGKPRIPVKASRAQLRVNNDARSMNQVSTSPLAVASPKLRSACGEEGQSRRVPLPVKATSSSSNTRSPNVKLLQGQTSPLRDKKESKAALVTVRGQAHGMLKNDRVSDVKSDGTKKNCEAHIAKSSTEVMKQKRLSRFTSNDKTSSLPRGSSPGGDFEYTETILPCEETVGTTQVILTKADLRDWENESEARVTAAGAMDQSVVRSDHDSCVDHHALGNSPARIRAKLQTLKDQHLPLKDFSDVKESCELTTPRGFRVGKCQALEKRQGSEGCEQRSPVSVLDNSVFEEDGSPSPIVTVKLQDSCESNRHGNQFCEVRLEIANNLATNSLPTEDTDSVSFVYPGLKGHCDPHGLPADMQLQIINGVGCDQNATSTSIRDTGRDFVDELLALSGVTKANWVSGAVLSREHSIINPRLLVEFEGDRQAASSEASAIIVFNKCHKQEQGENMNIRDSQALVDFVYELLTIKLTEYENAQPWLGSSWAGSGQQFKRQHLVNVIWKELREFPCVTSDDICDTVQGILQEDLGPRGSRWTDFRAEIGEVSVEVEKMIYRDLLEEVVKDLNCSSSSRYLAKLLEGTSGPRRQLFAL